VVNSLDRKLLRDLGQTWKMLLAVASIIGIGIGCFVGMLSAARNLTAAQAQYYSTCRMADFWIELKKAPVQEVLRIADLAGVSELRTRIQYQVMVDLPDEVKPVGGLMMSMPEEPQPMINGLVMRSGSYFSPGRANEVIVSEKFATARHLKVGDSLRIVMNGRSRELVVCGTAISSEFVYTTSPGSLVDDPEHYGMFYVKRSFAEDSFGYQGACNNLVGLLTPEARLHPEPVIQMLADRLEPYGVFTSIPRKQQFSHLTLSSELDGLGKMAYMFPLFFMVVAGLVLNVLMTRLIEQQRTVLGTLKALGYSSRELSLHYLKYGLAAGVFGGSVGAGVGYLLAEAMTSMYLIFFSFPSLVSGVYPDLMLTGVLISVVVGMLGAMNGVKRGMRLQPAEAMRPPAPPSGKRMFLERFPGFWRRLDIQWQMVLRELSRRKTRSAISIFSAAMGGSIVILAFGFVDSIDRMIQLQFDLSLKSDYHLTLSNEMEDSVLYDIRRLPGVAYAETVFNLPCTYRNGHRERRGVVIGIEPGSHLTQAIGAQGQGVAIPEQGLLMSDRLMEQLGVSVGDDLTLLPVRGEQRPLKVRVAAAFRSMMGLQVYANRSWLNRQVGEGTAVNEVRILAQHNAEEHRQFMQAIKEMPQLEAVMDIQRQKQALVEQMSGAMRGMAVVMIFFAAVIFFGAILNATLIALSERLREIATFDAMGYTRGEIGRLFLRENLLTTLTGAAIGAPLGHMMLIGMMQAFQTDAYAFPASIQPVSYLYTLLLAFCFVWTSQWVVHRSIRKMNRVEALAMKA